MITITVSEPMRALIEHALGVFVKQARRNQAFPVFAGHQFTQGEMADAYDAVADAPRNNLRPFLDLSTAHLRPETREMWSECFTAEHFPNTVLVGVHGWMMHVPTDNDGWDYRLGAELFEIFAHARSLGVDYLLFDADAPTIDALPTFDDDDDEGCPVGDPGCYSGAGDCHETCEAPPPAAGEGEPIGGEERAFIGALHVQHYEAGEIARLVGLRFGVARSRSQVAVILAERAVEAAHG